MEVVTYIVDTSTLVNNINSIKQWVYNGSIRILVPHYVLGQVEELYRAPVALKEPTKEQNQRKSWGKAPRKEQPLFDINPRIAWEYLERARSEKGELGVLIQGEGEKFSQWETAKEEVVKSESPPPPPTSFAGALLRKLNISETNETNGTEGPSKPKLVARSGEPKSPWTYHKVPKIPMDNITENLRPLFSCVLWRLHEFKANPLEPEAFALLSNEAEVHATAATVDVQVSTVEKVRQEVNLHAHLVDHRLEVGGIEIDFADHRNSTSAKQKEAQGNGHATLRYELGTPKVNGTIVEQKVSAPVAETPPVHHIAQSYQPFGSAASSPIPAAVGHSHPDRSPLPAPIGTGRPKEAPIGTGRPKSSKDAPNEVLNRDAATTSSLLDILMQGSNPDVPDNGLSAISQPPKPLSPIGEPIKPADPESEMDSDEEVIVFNPRARRASGRPRTPAGPPRSRPTTSHGPSASFDTLKPAKSPIFSTLKPQSPVFTPGQTYVPVSVAVQGPPVLPAAPLEERQANISPPVTRSPARSPQPRSVTPRRPRADLQQRAISHDHLQNQSRMIIQRQREAIERQVKAAAKPPPRQVQIEPTENPTVIDPDAFDRSYVVQQPAGAAPTPTANGKQRSAGRGRRSPKGKESPRQSVRKPTETPAAQDVDFVLKSGQPRGSTRSRGKLWIP